MVIAEYDTMVHLKRWDTKEDVDWWMGWGVFPDMDAIVGRIFDVAMLIWFDDGVKSPVCPFDYA